MKRVFGSQWFKAQLLYNFLFARNPIFLSIYIYTYIRSPDDRGPFRPMDTFQSRRVRNEQGRSDEKEKGRIGSDISSGRNRRGDSAARRSRSRERNNTQRTRRSRSKSPPSEFIKVLERWKKFKQSQRVRYNWNSPFDVNRIKY